jgi:FdhD protein
MRRAVNAVPEEAVRLEVNHRIARSWSASPSALDALAAGHLLTSGYLRSTQDLLGIRVSHDGGVHRLEADVEPGAAQTGFDEAAHRQEHGCGPRYFLDCRADRPSGGGPGGAVPPPDDRFPDLFRQLFEHSPSRRESGGHHTAALCDGETVIHVHEEVGRHNAVDKAIGSAFLNGDDLRGLGLLVTARISGEIAEKAARAGLGWVASRSVPTTLAVEIARGSGVVLLARAPSPEARRFP